MLLVSNYHNVEFLIDNDVNSSRLLVESPTIITDIAYDEIQSTVYWITAAGVGRSKIGMIGRSLNYRLNNVLPTGLDIDKMTGNIYVSVIVNETHRQDRSVIKIISKLLSAEVDIITTQTMITDIALDVNRGILFWSDHSKTYTGRIVRSTMDGQSTVWLSGIKEIVYPVALALDPIRARVYWADLRLNSISSCDYDGKFQKTIVSQIDGQPSSITFFEGRISWSLRKHENIYSRKINEATAIKLPMGSVVERLLTTSGRDYLNSLPPNPCEGQCLEDQLCVLKNVTSFNCFSPTGVNRTSAMLSTNLSAAPCPRKLFRCLPNMDCHSRNVICKKRKNCKDLSDDDLCAILNESVHSETFNSSGPHSRRISSSHISSAELDLKSNISSSVVEAPIPWPLLWTTIFNGSRRKMSLSLRLDVTDEGNQEPSFSTDGLSELETSLKAILDGPVYVLSRLFTKKGHYIGNTSMNCMQSA